MKKYLSPSLFALAGIAAIVTMGCQAPAPPPPPTDYAAQYGPLLDGFLDAWSTGNLEQLDDIMAADFRRTAPQGGPADAGSLAEMKTLMTTFRTAWPDAKVVANEAFHQEGATFLRWTFTGTNTGEGESPPTGLPAEVSGFTLLRYADGKIISEDVEYDALDFMQQLGMTLAPAGDG